MVQKDVALYKFFKIIEKEGSDFLSRGESLETMAAIYRTVLDKISAGVHVINKEGKTIVYNKKMMDIEGMDIEDVLDKNILEVFDFNQAGESTLLHVLKSGKPIVNMKQTYFNNRGQEIHTINNTFPVIVNDDLVGAVEIARDVTLIERLMKKSHYSQKNRSITFEQIIGNNPFIKEAIEIGKRTANSSSPVLIIGEKGTGKELLAQGIHHASDRSKQPFITQNCSYVTKSMMENLLFGSKHASDYPTLFEQAQGGTVLLKDIHRLDLTLQEKLLHFIQQLTRKHTNNVRLITTINEDPIDMVAAGKLHKVLYYKLSTTSIFIPSLRNRREDVPLLTSHFIQKYNKLFGLNVKGTSSEVKKLVNNYRWPGNVRELEHVIEASMNMIEAETTIKMKHLPGQYRNKSQALTSFLLQKDKEIKPLDTYMQEAEIYYIEKALQVHDHNITQTAKALGMSRQNLQYRMRKYNIERES